MLSLLSCRKDEIEAEFPTKLEGESSLLIGEWEWDSTEIIYQAIAPWPVPNDYIYADSVGYSHSIKIYEEGKVEFLKNDQIERSHYFTLSTFKKSQWADSIYWFATFLDDDSTNLFEGYLGEWYENNYDVLQEFYGYPDPILDTAYEYRWAYFTRQ